ncbi:MAG: M23 family metallopeptidase [Actinomycetota bacterium]
MRRPTSIKQRGRSIRFGKGVLLAALLTVGFMPMTAGAAYEPDVVEKLSSPRETCQTDRPCCVDGFSGSNTILVQSWDFEWARCALPTNTTSVNYLGKESGTSCTGKWRYRSDIQTVAVKDGCRVVVRYETAGCSATRSATVSRSVRNGGGDVCQPEEPETPDETYIVPLRGYNGNDIKIWNYFESDAGIDHHAWDGEVSWDLQPTWTNWSRERHSVLAVAKGTASWECAGTYQSRVKLTTDGGAVFGYAHLDTPSVRSVFGTATERKVEQGEVIGYLSHIVGDPAESTPGCRQLSHGVHLHFETPRGITIGDYELTDERHTDCKVSGDGDAYCVTGGSSFSTGEFNCWDICHRGWMWELNGYLTFFPDRPPYVVTSVAEKRLAPVDDNCLNMQLPRLHLPTTHLDRKLAVGGWRIDATSVCP